MDFEEMIEVGDYNTCHRGMNVKSMRDYICSEVEHVA